MKLLAIEQNCKYLPITFSINLPKIFNKTMEQKDFEESQMTLLGLEMIMDKDTLKYTG